MPTSRAEARSRVASPETSSDSRAVASAAAGHRELRLREPALQPRPDDLVPPAGDERDDPDAEGGDHVLHRPRDRPADEGLDAQLRQAGRPPARRSGGERLLRRRDDLSGLRRDDVKVPRRVEDGCDPAVPAGESRFRAEGRAFSVHARNRANATPGRSEHRECRRTHYRRRGCARDREDVPASQSSATATLFGTYGSAGATPSRTGRSVRPVPGAPCRACGCAGRASSCGCRAPGPPRAG